MEKNGRKYTKHPTPHHHVSDFPLGHRGCYLCGGLHVFRDCSRGQEHRALQRIRFNMHCHQTKLYFKIEGDNTNQGPQQGYFNQNNVLLSEDTSFKQQNKRVKFEQNQHSGGI